MSFNCKEVSEQTHLSQIPEFMLPLSHYTAYSPSIALIAWSLSIKEMIQKYFAALFSL